MKKLQILMLLVSGVFFYPFGCEAQQNGTIPNSDGCDTIEIESPKQAEAIKTATATIDSLTTLTDFQAGKITEWIDESKRLGVIINEKDLIISTQSNEISSLNTAKIVSEAEVSRLTDTIASKDTEISVLIGKLAEKPSEEIVYVDRDSITVGGINYKVSDIEEILPHQTTDTIQLGWCEPDPTVRDYFHEGNKDVYPHWVNFASAKKGMVKVWLTEELTPEAKAQDSITVQRIISHKIGLTQLIYINE